MAHTRRPELHLHTPLHVTLRAVERAPNLRAERVFAIIDAEIRAAVRRGHRIVHFSVQHNHVHLVIEVDEDVGLGRRMQRLVSRIAQLINAMTGRRGALWRDRYHRRDITSPRQMRRTLVYVLFNERKHSPYELVREESFRLDPCSSTLWFTEWNERAPPPKDYVARVRARHGPSPLMPARTWLLRTGYKQSGRLRFGEVPKIS